MSNTLSFQIDTTDASMGLGVEVWLDQTKLIDQDWVKDTILFRHEFEDNDSTRQLKFVLKNKKTDHTTVDDLGNILQDARILISNVAFDDIKLGHALTELAVYVHNTNGNTEIKQDKFYGEMGCNGTVTLEFTTPIYLWLLEHL